MSRFISKRIQEMSVYVPGEQPQGGNFIKLNTNENPYPPSPMVTAALREMPADKPKLYPDPSCMALKRAIAEFYKLDAKEVFVGNGSDEVLSSAFRAFFDEGDKVYFADITYGFYKVYSSLYGLQATEIPLATDFHIELSDYMGLDGHMLIANPNAPTGLYHTRQEMEAVIQANPDRLVIIDEAYIDFGGESCIPLIRKYDNLLVVQTFSKSRALAGMRLGFGIGSPALVEALEKVKFSMNPYNINQMTMAAGIASMQDRGYFEETTRKIVATRERFSAELQARGFTVLPSRTNFVFAKSQTLSGRELYEYLKDRKILVRHFDVPRISEYLRISIGTDQEMDALLAALPQE
ncbi:MAG TPA: histidinol-phosphate transaminase [Firmicutes bacterium]|nr:histidinol-phosphate transaminase [Bacillota bacterium]